MTRQEIVKAKSEEYITHFTDYLSSIINDATTYDFTTKFSLINDQNQIIGYWCAAYNDGNGLTMSFDTPKEFGLAERVRLLIKNQDHIIRDFYEKVQNYSSESDPLLVAIAEAISKLK